MATTVFMAIPPSVLPATTTLSTEPKECFGTTSTMIAVMFISILRLRDALRRRGDVRPARWRRSLASPSAGAAIFAAIQHRLKS